MEKEKIKAEELRIGNYVNVIWSTRIEEVVEITKNDVKLKTGYASYDQLTGIELTEDWLICFEFDNSVMRHIYTKGMISINVGNHMTIMVNSKVIRQIDNKFVHTLQNLYFAIEQEELTIKP